MNIKKSPLLIKIAVDTSYCIRYRQLIEPSNYIYSLSKLAVVENTSNEKRGQLNKLARVTRGEASANQYWLP